jgi:glutaconate CoA-transferase, subunit B
MGLDKRSKRMQVESLHPGVAFEQTQESTGFELLNAAVIGRTEPPRSEELKILREEVDPHRYIIGR